MFTITQLIFYIALTGNIATLCAVLQFNSAIHRFSGQKSEQIKKPATKTTTSPKASIMAKIEIDAGQFDFSLKLYKTLSSNANSVVSPFSVISALSMTLYGARGNTGRELSKVLFGKVIEQKDYRAMVQTIKSLIDTSVKSNAKVLSTANFIYSHTKYPILPDFKQTLENFFYAKSRELDLVGHQSEAVKIINNDISVATKGKIPNLIESIDPLTRLILTNAVYFKGLWKSPFKPNATKPEEFTLTDGSKVNVNMMFQNTKFQYGYSDELKSKAIELAYEGSNIAMVLLLPDEESSLKELETNLNSEFLNILLNNLTPVKVALSLPKFKLKSSHHLVPALSKLGIKDVFSSKAANFNGITNHPMGLFVGDVIQKAVIEVNEEGTEAAAATAVMFLSRSMDFPEEFKANRPFLFMLVSKYEANKRLILFMGAVKNPKA